MFASKGSQERAAMLEKLAAMEKELAALREQAAEASRTVTVIRAQQRKAEEAFAAARAEMQATLADMASQQKMALEFLDWRPNQNIRRRLFAEAGRDTAQYVLEHMGKVRAFNVALDILPYAVAQTKTEGSYLEFGVFSGTTINTIAAAVPDKTVYGFDSFDGLPEDWRTGYEKGTYKVDALPQVRENVRLVKGWFEDTLPGFAKEHPEPCAFIHVDCDLYSSAKTVFRCLKDKIVSGTVIVFDEYFNYPGWREGEYKAFQEFIAETGHRYEYLAYVEILEQAAVRIL